MCILIVKPKDKLTPTKEILKECFTRNPDGAGFCYNKDGNIVIRKGFMNFEEFYTATQKIPTESTALIHCRIGTSGGNIPELTHPYPLTNNIKELKKTTLLLKGGDDKPVYAVGHNGVFYGLKTPYPEGVNDTCVFIANLLTPLKNIAPDLLDESLDAIINKLVDTSRIAILDNNGRVKMYGTGWIEDDGIYYSNNTYKKVVYSTYNYGGKSWKSYYDSYNDDYYDNKWFDDILIEFGSWKNYQKWVKMSENQKLQYLVDSYPEWSEMIEEWKIDGYTATQIKNWITGCEKDGLKV